MDRPSWDTTYLGMAYWLSLRSTCPKLAVGMIVVTEDHRLVVAGYNGAPPGHPHCADVGCDIGDGGRCHRAVHAEQNAVAFAARHGIAITGCSVYLTHIPCTLCARLLITAGIQCVVCVEPYGSRESIYRVTSMFARSGLDFRIIDISVTVPLSDGLSSLLGRLSAL